MRHEDSGVSSEGTHEVETALSRVIAQVAGLATTPTSRERTVPRGPTCMPKAISFMFLQTLYVGLGFHFDASAPRAQPASQDKLPSWSISAQFPPKVSLAPY